MIALLANTQKADRAVATGLRNFIRTIGGAVGLSIGSAILNNVLLANIPASVTAQDALQFTGVTHLTPEQKDAIVDAYEKGIRTIMFLGAPMVGLMLLDSLVLTEVRLDSLVPASGEAAQGGPGHSDTSETSTEPAGAKPELAGETQLFGGEPEVARDLEKMGGR